MGDAYWAAREGDVLLHTSMLADLAGAAVEIACYAAVTAALTAAISFPSYHCHRRTGCCGHRRMCWHRHEPFRREQTHITAR